jgi:hypothetical protein
MRNPWLTGTRIRKRISVRNTVVFGNVLPGLEVPPDIGIAYIAQCQGEQAEKNDREESALNREPARHAESIIAGEWRAR